MKWEKVAIKDICTGIYDGPHATPPLSDTGAIFLGISNFNNGRLDFSDIRYISEDDLPKWTKRVIPQKNDIVFSYEATLNLYAIIPEGFRGCLGRRMALLRVDETKADYKFLYYYFYSDTWRATVNENIVLGATVDRIPLIKFPDFPVELPPLETQHRIADILSAYDDLIENNQKQIKLLEEAAQRLYKEWFVNLRFPGHENTKIVDGVPEGWRVASIVDICDTVGGGTPSTKIQSYYEKGDILWVTPTDITRNFSLALLDTEKKITPEGLKNSSAKMLPAETILMTSRASVGFFGMCKYEVCTNQGFISCIPKRENLQMYLLFNLKSRVEEIRQKAGGSTYLEISKTVFRELKIILPKDEVLAEYQKNVHDIFDEIYCRTEMIKSLVDMRNRVLPKLMSGEVEV